MPLLTRRLIMYNLPYHKENDPKVVVDFIARYPFAYISGCDANNRPIATQIPMFIETHNGRQILRGHMMKKTDHHLAFTNNPHVLVVFSGHHTYVSGSWYSNPHTPSTWNYMSVHAGGTIRFLDETALEEVLQLTSLHFEGGNEQSPTVYSNLPADYRQKLLKAIVAFEIEITKLDTVFKLSQDRDPESYEHIISMLKQQDEAGRVIAEEMEKRRK